MPAVRRGKPVLKRDERRINHFKMAFTNAEYDRFNAMKEFTGCKGGELVRRALDYYAENALKM